jgi:sporulation protein YlmC with PRC-barrel domain
MSPQHRRKEGAMSVPQKATLLKLSDSSLTVAFAEDDIRGRRVVDRNGDEVGDVDDLIIDDREQKVRFMQVGTGGVLGMGETKLLIPIDAITRITADTVSTDQTRERMVGAPRYDPALVRDTYWEDVYGYYGYSPYWTPGYVYPPYPAYPM